MIRNRLCRLLCATLPLPALIATVAQAAPSLRAIEKAHYEAEWSAKPSDATSAGIHRYDTRLDDVSLPFIARQAARLHRERAALTALDVSTLPQREQDDRDILVAVIDRELIDAERIQPFRRMPDSYVSLATESLYGLIDRDFAPLPVRMRAVIARERQIPALLALAEKQLADVPPVFLEIAREDLAGSFDFVGKNVPAAFASVTDTTLQTQLKATTQTTLAALARYRDFLNGLKATGQFALGADTMRAMLATDLVDLPLDRIVDAGKAQLRKDQADFVAAERMVDPAHPDQALAAVREDHPTAENLNRTVLDQLKQAQDFVVSRNLLHLPSMSLPEVLDTPGFERSLITAATEWPGPFETHATTSFYYVTPIDPHLGARQAQEALEDFNRPALLNITVHEAMPGHFVQGLYLRANPQWSLVRRASASYATTEGWAHYTEQMMIEQGFDQANPKLHLMQLQDALLRDCRFLAAFGMHAQGMSLADATTMMQHECHQSSVAAYKEARRGTADPQYYAYTLGKLMILHLRDDMRAHQGSTFSLAAFHDGLLGAGLVPMKIIRREMTGEDAPLL